MPIKKRLAIIRA